MQGKKFAKHKRALAFGVSTAMLISTIQFQTRVFASEATGTTTSTTNITAMEGHPRDSASTRNVYTQFVDHQDARTLHFDSIIQFHVNPLDLWGKNNTYNISVPDSLRPYIDHVESDMYGVGGSGRHWTWDDTNKVFSAPLMSVSGGLFSNTWIGSNPNYVPTRIVLNKDWNEIKAELQAKEGNALPISFYGRFSNGDIISNITNDTYVPLSEDLALQDVKGPGGGQLSDNFISNSFVYIKPDQGYNEDTKSFEYDHYLHISPFVTYNTAMGNKPYLLNLQLKPELAALVKSVEVTGIAGLSRRTVTFDRTSFPKSYDASESTGIIRLNIFDDPSIPNAEAAKQGTLIAYNLVGAYPLPMHIKVNFQDDVNLEKLMQDGVELAESGNRNVYFATYMTSAKSDPSGGGSNGVVKNTYAGTYISLTDSDKDGLLDRTEQYTTFTNPNNDDTDGDGKKDKDEIDAGTDPNVATPQVTNISYTTKEYEVNTAPYRLVKLVKEDGTVVAEKRADSEGHVTLNINGKIKSKDKLKVQIFTDEQAKNDYNYTQVYTNPEESEVFEVLEATPAEEVTFEMANKEKATPPYREGGNFASGGLGTADYTIKYSVKNTARNDEYTVRVYKNIAPEGEAPIYQKIAEETTKIGRSNEQRIILTKQAMEGVFKNGETLYVTTQRKRVSDGVLEAETAMTDAAKVTAIGRYEAPKISVDLTSLNSGGNGYKNLNITAGDDILPQNGGGNNVRWVVRLGNLWSFTDRKKIEYQAGKDAHSGLDPLLIAYSDHGELNGQLWFDGVVDPSYGSFNGGTSVSTTLGALGNADMYTGQYVTAYVVDNAGRFSLPAYIPAIPKAFDKTHVTNIELISPPDKREYDAINKSDDPTETTLDLTGAVVKLTDKDGHEMEVPAEEFENWGIKASPDKFENLKAGDEGEKTITFTSVETQNSPFAETKVTVLPPVFDPSNITDMTLVKGPDQTTYTVGDSFNPKGMEVELTDKNGVKKTIKGEELIGYGIIANLEDQPIASETGSYTPFDSQGDKQLVFKKEGVDKTFNVDVKVGDLSAKPSVEPVTQTSKEIVVTIPKDGDTPRTGKVQVRIFDPITGQPTIYDAVDNGDGTFKVTLPPDVSLKDGQPIDAIFTETDKAPNTSDMVYVGVEKSAPVTDLSSDGKKVTGKTTAPEGTPVTLVTDENGVPVVNADGTPVTAKVGENGTIEIDLTNVPEDQRPKQAYVKLEEPGKSPSISGPVDIPEPSKELKDATTTSTARNGTNEGTTKVIATLPDDAKEGDKVVVSGKDKDGRQFTEEHVITGDDLTNGEVTIDLGNDKVKDNEDLTVSYQEDGKAPSEKKVTVDTDETKAKEKLTEAEGDSYTGDPTIEAAKNKLQDLVDADTKNTEPHPTQKDIDDATDELDKALRAKDAADAKTSTPEVTASNTPASTSEDGQPVPGKTELKVKSTTPDKTLTNEDVIKVSIPNKDGGDPTVTEYKVGDPNVTLNDDGSVTIDLGNQIPDGTEITVTLTEKDKTESDPAKTKVTVNTDKADEAIDKVPENLDTTDPIDKAVDDAKKELDEVLKKDGKTQEEVDNATKKLEDALKAKAEKDGKTVTPSVSANTTAGSVVPSEKEDEPDTVVPGKTEVTVTPGDSKTPFNDGDKITVTIKDKTGGDQDTVREFTVGDPEVTKNPNGSLTIDLGNEIPDGSTIEVVAKQGDKEPSYPAKTTVTVDTSKATEAKDKADKEILDPTKPADQKVQEVKDELDKVLADPDKTQKQVDEATKKLEDALKEKDAADSKTTTPEVTATNTAATKDDDGTEVPGKTVVKVTGGDKENPLKNGDVIKVKVGDGEETEYTVGTPGVTLKEDGTVEIDLGNEIPNGTEVTVTVTQDGKTESDPVKTTVTVDNSKGEETLKKVPSSDQLDPNDPTDQAVTKAKEELEKVLKDENRTQKDVDEATKKLEEALKDKAEKDGKTVTPSVSANTTAGSVVPSEKEDEPDTVVPGKTEVTVTPGDDKTPFTDGDTIKVTIKDKTDGGQDTVKEFTVGDPEVTKKPDGTLTIDLGNEIPDGSTIEVVAKQGDKEPSDPAKTTVTVNTDKADEAINKVPENLDTTDPTDKAVDDAKKELEEVLEKDDKTQKDVDDATKKLEDALKDKAEKDGKTTTPEVTATNTAATKDDDGTEVPGKTVIKVTGGDKENPLKDGDVIKVKVGDGEEKEYTVGTPGVSLKEDGTVEIDLGNEIPNGTEVTVTVTQDGKTESDPVKTTVTVDNSKGEETLKKVPSSDQLDPNDPTDQAVTKAKEELEKVLKDENRTQKDVDEATKKLEDALKDKADKDKQPAEDNKTTTPNVEINNNSGTTDEDGNTVPGKTVVTVESGDDTPIKDGDIVKIVIKDKDPNGDGNGDITIEKEVGKGDIVVDENGKVSIDLGSNVPDGSKVEVSLKQGDKDESDKVTVEVKVNTDDANETLKQVPENLDNTKDADKKVEEAKDVLEKVLNDPDKTQSKVDEATKQLKDALKNKENVDKGNETGKTEVLLIQEYRVNKDKGETVTKEGILNSVSLVGGNDKVELLDKTLVGTEDNKGIVDVKVKVGGKTETMRVYVPIVVNGDNNVLLKTSGFVTGVDRDDITPEEILSNIRLELTPNFDKNRIEGPVVNTDDLKKLNDSKNDLRNAGKNGEGRDSISTYVEVSYKVKKEASGIANGYEKEYPVAEMANAICSQDKELVKENLSKVFTKIDFTKVTVEDVQNDGTTTKVTLAFEDGSKAEVSYETVNEVEVANNEVADKPVAEENVAAALENEVPAVEGTPEANAEENAEATPENGIEEEVPEVNDNVPAVETPVKPVVNNEEVAPAVEENNNETVRTECPIKEVSYTYKAIATVGEATETRVIRVPVLLEAMVVGDGSDITEPTDGNLPSDETVATTEPSSEATSKKPAKKPAGGNGPQAGKGEKKVPVAKTGEESNMLGAALLLAGVALVIVRRKELDKD